MRPSPLPTCAAMHSDPACCVSGCLPPPDFRPEVHGAVERLPTCRGGGGGSLTPTKSEKGLPKGKKEGKSFQKIFGKLEGGPSDDPCYRQRESEATASAQPASVSHPPA